MKDESTTGVYDIIHTASGKRYVGSAANSFKTRWRQHRNHLRAGKHKSAHLQAAWNKYGEATFEFRIIRITEPHEAVEYEQAYIDMYKAADRKHGYNIAPIAGSMRGTKRTASQKAAISELSKKQQSTQAARQAASERTKKYFSDPAARQAHSEKAKRQWADLAARQAMSEKKKKYCADPAVRLAMSERGKKRFEDPALCRETSEKTKRQFADPAARKASSEIAKKRYEDPAVRQAASEKTKTINADPVRRAAILVKGRITRASKKLVILQ
jgi:group I intron endonuclease